jgi:hypothetical protein
MLLKKALKYVKLPMLTGSVHAMRGGIRNRMVVSRIKLKDAEKEYTIACRIADDALANAKANDWALLVTEGTRIIWGVVVNLLRAAEKTGPDNLPDDIEPPSIEGQLYLDDSRESIMKAQKDLEAWGIAMAKAAGAEPVKRLSFKKRVIRCD